MLSIFFGYIIKPDILGDSGAYTFVISALKSLRQESATSKPASDKYKDCLIGNQQTGQSNYNYLLTPKVLTLSENTQNRHKCQSGNYVPTAHSPSPFLLCSLLCPNASYPHIVHLYVLPYLCMFICSILLLKFM